MCAVVKQIVTHWILSHFSSESRDPSYNVPVSWLKYLKKDWTRLALLTIPEVDQGPSDGITSPNWLGPVEVWIQRNYQRLLKTVRYFHSCNGCYLCRDPSERKNWVWKWMNEMQLEGPVMTTWLNRDFQKAIACFWVSLIFEKNWRSTKTKKRKSGELFQLV